MDLKMKVHHKLFYFYNCKDSAVYGSNKYHTQPMKVIGNSEGVGSKIPK